MADQPQNNPVRAKATAPVASPPLDVIVPAGPLALVEGAVPINLHKASSFGTKNALEFAPLFDGKKTGPLKTGALSLPVSSGEMYLERLRTLRALLSPGTSGADLKKAVLTAKAKVDETLKTNLRTVMAGQRAMERAWRELDAFVKLARKDAGAAVPLRVANVSVETLCTDDSKFQQLSTAIPKISALSMQEMVALLVLPGWVSGKPQLQKFGEMALKAKMTVIVGTPEEIERARDLFGKDGTMKDIAGSERWRQQMILVANNLRIRKADPNYESPNDGLYISAATVLAGSIAKGDEIRSMADAQAGAAREIMLEGDDVVPHWKLVDREQIVATVGDRIIPVATQGKKTVFWGAKTLYDVAQDDSKYLFGQYPNVRVRDYIEKVLIEFMNNEQIFRSNTKDRRQNLKDTINTFLRENSGDEDDSKMLSGGECTHVESRVTPGGIVDDTKLDIGVPLKFKAVAENASIEVKAKKEGDSWREETGD